jgi:hydroxymethylglutaryl-CoA lyase
MLQYPQRVAVYEVGPRDGLQNEPAPVPTDVKVELVNRLAAAGLPYVEVSSFVHPRWIPQLGDAEDVFARIERLPDVRYGALVPNLRGLERAREVGLRDVALFISSSEAHNKRNLNRSIDESFEDIEAVMAQLAGSGCWVRGYVSMVFGCPYEGDVPVDRVKNVIERLLALGVDQVSLGDTVGLASPASVSRVVGSLTDDLPAEKMALHFHDTRGTALANVIAGLDAGISIFDGAVGGLGGCPYAPGATGNVATEDLVQMLHSMGIETGIDLDALVDAAAFIEAKLRKRLPGRYLRVARGTYSSS